MRQFLFGLSVAAVAWWMWSGPAAAPEDGVPPGGPPAGSAGSANPVGDDLPDLAAALRGGSGGAGADTGRRAPAQADPAAGGAPHGGVAPQPLQATSGGDDAASANAPSGRDPAVQAAFDRLVAQIEAGDDAARGQALRVLGHKDLWPEHRVRLRSMLGLEEAAVRRSDLGSSLAGAGVGSEQVDEALARLGSGNGFLQSAEGRELGKRVLDLLAGLDDAKATAAGTALLERCMQGAIGNDDRAALDFVNAAYEVHRVHADRYLCDPANLAKARSYEVRRGDSLGAIAARFRRENLIVEEGTLAILNRIHNANSIQVGQRIKVPLDPVRAVLEKRSFMLAVYVGDQILRLYRVGHGENGKTPVTTFTVSEKLKNPDWYAPDGRVVPAGSPGNILGSYFIKFKNPSYTGFGAHGTPMPETIGTESSMGCIRMYDDDIAELFQLLPRGAEVEVRDSH